MLSRQLQPGGLERPGRGTGEFCWVGGGTKDKKGLSHGSPTLPQNSDMKEIEECWVSGVEMGAGKTQWGHLTAYLLSLGLVLNFCCDMMVI